jgi:hypothetical protein
MPSINTLLPVFNLTKASAFVGCYLYLSSHDPQLMCFFRSFQIRTKRPDEIRPLIYIQKSKQMQSFTRSISKPPLRPDTCVGEMPSILKILNVFPAGGGFERIQPP